MESLLLEMSRRERRRRNLWRWALWIRSAYDDAFVGDSLPPGPQLAAGMLLMVQVGTVIAFTASMVLQPDVTPWWYGALVILAVYALGGLGYYWLLRTRIGGYADTLAGPHKKKRTKMEILSQVMLLIGALGMVFVGSGNPWGFVIAMVQQPFWYYTSITNRLWGLLAASGVYTVAWVLGIYNNWDKYFAYF